MKLRRAATEQDGLKNKYISSSKKEKKRERKKDTFLSSGLKYLDVDLVPD